MESLKKEFDEVALTYHNICSETLHTTENIQRSENRINKPAKEEQLKMKRREMLDAVGPNRVVQEIKKKAYVEDLTKCE